MTEVHIRPLQRREFDKVWPIFHAIISAGETYSYSPDTTKEQGASIWFAEEKTPYIAELDTGEAVGTFYLRDNQLGLGDHIANGGFMVAPHHAGKGYGTKMAECMITEAKRAGYTGMQFNFIVEGNDRSLNIWKKLGFEIVGTVPDAMRHSKRGLVPVHIMYKRLVD
tara:strand:+ start:370 stop:870 length:501 start_codon:yes stop_codon:yes gene_type:complete